MEDQGYLSNKVCSGRLICDKESSVLSALPFLVQTGRQEGGGQRALPTSAVGHLLQLQKSLCQRGQLWVAHSDPLHCTSAWLVFILGVPSKLALPAPHGLCLAFTYPGVLGPESSTSSGLGPARSWMERIGRQPCTDQGPIEPRAGMEK